MHPSAKKPLDLSSLKLTQDFPSRPGYGTRGMKVELTANYVELLPPSNLTLFRYDIQIVPEVAGRKHFRIVQLLLETPELAPFKMDVATDFRSTLISKKELPEEELIIDIPYRSEGEDDPAPNATIYKARVLYTKTLTLNELTDYLNSTNLSQRFTDKQELIQALNIFLNHHSKASNTITTMGSTKSFSTNQPQGGRDLGSGLEVIRGFFSSVRVATCRILVNINVSHGAFFHGGPLPGLMQSYGTYNTAALEKFLRLIRIQTTHLPEKRNRANQVIPRVKTIFGLARRDDGHGLAHPPRVSKHGAGPKEVEFWLEGGAGSSNVSSTSASAATSVAPSVAGTDDGSTKSKGKGKAKKARSQASSAAGFGSGKYISVFDFFRTSKCMFLEPAQLLT